MKVRDKGACKPSLGGIPDADFDSVRMGAARVASGEVLPVAEVDSTVLDAAPARQRLLAGPWRALRPTTAHGRDGLAKAVVSAAELGGRPFSFHQGEIRRFRGALAPQ